MSFQSPNATLPTTALPARSGLPFAHEIAALVQDIQRTREWFNSQLDAQLASLHKLCTPAQSDESTCSLSMATLFDAPRPMMLAPAVESAPAAPEKRPATAQQAIILSPTLTATLDPQLEQATLHELNNALTRAFSEISARGGMINGLAE
jgi:hypothetical protein